MYVIIDMHWSSKGTAKKAVRQLPMPDERYAPAFWTSVAHVFASNPAVIFDLYNEPFPNRNTDSAASWKCDLDGSAGGTCKGIGFRAAGMQQLLGDVRAAGATNVIMVGGPQYAGDLDHWLQYEPVDPLGQLAASIHVYWNTPASPKLVALLPVVVLEQRARSVVLARAHRGGGVRGARLRRQPLSAVSELRRPTRHLVPRLGLVRGELPGRALTDHQLLGHAHRLRRRLPAASGIVRALSPTVS